jgi:hypothetical protein
MMYNKKNSYFLKCLDLESMGFILTDTDNEMYQFRKTKNGITIFLDVIIISNKFYGTGSWLVFDEIESSIDNLLDKYQIEDVKRYPMTIVFNKLQTQDYNQLYMDAKRVSFDNKGRIMEVAGVVKKHINQVFMPLWEKYSDWQFVNDEIINKLSIDKLSDYISGVSIHFKVLMIMKKCNNPAYQEYLNNQLKALLELSESELGKIQAEQYFNDSFFWRKQYEMMLEMDAELRKIRLH